MPTINKSCWYCGCELRQGFKTSDHQVPSSRGGRNDPANLVEACLNCNSEKKDMNVEEYRTYVWLQKIGSPAFSYAQVAWLKKMQFRITVSASIIPDWDGKFHGEKALAQS